MYSNYYIKNLKIKHILNLLGILLLGFCFLYSEKIYSSLGLANESSNNENVLSKKTISVMTYNLENLFDTEDDPKKNDEAYLPKDYKLKNQTILRKCNRIKDYRWRNECLNLDWSEKAMYSKMNRISDVILKSHNWIGPDILILQEVENLKTIETLRTKYLKKYFPYPAILIEGQDDRGIDLAILSKLPLNSKPKLHPVTSRGILESELILKDKSKISVLAVHFPSQRSPYKKRKTALEKLDVIIGNLPKENLILVAGDMNITNDELKSFDPFKAFKSRFYISHLDGCKTCLGTHYYGPKKSWSFLDVIMVSKNHPNWKLDIDSISIFNKSLYQTNTSGLPEKFNLGKKQTGVSDHWPLKLEIFKN